MTDDYFVLSQSTRLTDGRTDRRTEKGDSNSALKTVKRNTFAEK